MPTNNGSSTLQMVAASRARLKLATSGEPLQGVLITVHTFLFGALLLQALRSIAHRHTRGHIAITMLAAAALQTMTLCIQGLIVPHFGNHTYQGQIISIVQAWTQVVAVILVAWICMHRALAIRYTHPWIAPIAKVLTGGFICCTIVARSLNLPLELPTLLAGKSTRAPQSAVIFRLVGRTIMNFAAIVYLSFMEVYVTAQIARYRTTAADSDSEGIRRRSSRLRITFAMLIFALLVVQTGLCIFNFFGSNVPAPLYLSTWTLVLIRLFEFREELSEPSKDVHLLPTATAATATTMTQGPVISRAPSISQQPRTLLGEPARLRVGSCVAVALSSGSSTTVVPQSQAPEPPTRESDLKCDGGDETWDDKAMRRELVELVTRCSRGAGSNQPIPRNNDGQPVVVACASLCAPRKSR